MDRLVGITTQTSRKNEMANKKKPRRTELCQKCKEREPVDRYRKRWLCEECLNEDQNPATIYDHMFSSSNLGEAD